MASNKQSGTIFLSRESDFWAGGSQVNSSVLIDGIQAATIDNNEKLRFSIPIGIYSFQVRINTPLQPMESNILQINVVPDRDIFIRCTTPSVWELFTRTSPLLEECSPFSHPPLEPIMYEPKKEIPHQVFDFTGASIPGGVAGYNFGKMVETQINNAADKQNLAEAALEIQKLLAELQNKGITKGNAQQGVAQELANKAKNDPDFLHKLVNWGQSLGNTTVNEVVKEVVKIALKLLIPGV